MSVLLAAALSQALVPTAILPASGADPCERFDRSSARYDERRRRRMTVSDLVEMADIGRSTSDPEPPPFGLSPNGKRMAFQVRRANAQTNSYCQRLLVAATEGTPRAVEVDRGGAFIRDDTRLRSFPSIKAGWAKTITPRWAPDGHRIAYLKRENDSTQVWIADADGGTPAYRATELADDVDDFAWAPDGNSLIVASRPALRRDAEAIAREGRSGFLFDERFSPQFAGRPIPRGPLPRVYQVIDLATGTTRPASAVEAHLIDPPVPMGLPEQARAYAASGAGAAAWLEPMYPERLIGPTRVVIAGGGVRRSCSERDCQGIEHLWWSADGRTLFAQQRTGWANSRSALLRWAPGAAAPRRVLETADALIGCAPRGDELICAREGSTQPRRLVAIDMRSGTQRLIFDPNPQFGSFTLGAVRRFHFRNTFGNDSFADLVLPPDHERGEKHPLVVVQYRSQGFLRGGTGNEDPIQLLASAGFAVLSFERPDFVPDALAATTEAQLRLANRKDWIDRRQVESSLERAIALAVGTGTVDASRMGISGFSDGATTAQWALIHSSLFKVAALGSCCEDMYAFPLAAGPEFTDFAREMGYRFLEPGAAAFWKPLSLVENADAIDEPILIQTGDSEYEGGLDVVEAFRHRGKAIELYVFENEPHVKWQPAHRQAMFERTVDWFAFWLQHRMVCSAAKAPQYARWTAMRGAPDPADLRCQ